MASALQEGDAPSVRDLLLEHFRDPRLEVEGKLGRRSLHKFTAGLSAEQYQAVEAQLLAGAPQLGLPSGSPAPLVEDTVDHFYAEPEVEPEEQEQAELQPPKPKQKATKETPKLRSSFACDESGCARGEPFEVIFKTRLSDCHVGRPSGDNAPPENAHVDVRVSFSLEVPAESACQGSQVVYRRRKRRRTFEAPLYRVQLTHVDVMDGSGVDRAAQVAPKRELFEVEVELLMDIVRPRLEEASNAADEALCITRELVAALRCLASWAVEAKTSKKRKRLEGFQAVEPSLRAILEESEVREELHRLSQEAGEGRPALPKAKHFLFDLLKSRHPGVNESALYHFAGKQVARIFHGQLGTAGLAAAAATATQLDEA